MTPVLVGGLAVELYTKGGYATKDIDALLSETQETQLALDRIGFSKRGCGWEHREHKFFIEFPGRRNSHPYLKTIHLPVRGTTIEVESIEHSIVMRLHHYSLGQMGDGISAIAMLLSGWEIAWDYLYRLALDEQVLPLLRSIIRLAAETDWSNPPSRIDMEHQLFWLKNPERRPIMSRDGEEGSDESIS